MTNSDKGTSTPRDPSTTNVSGEGRESVFADRSAPKPDVPTEHPGSHGKDGQDNDLDAAEEAGREGGRR